MQSAHKHSLPVCAHLLHACWQWVVSPEDSPQLLQPGVQAGLIARGVLQQGRGGGGGGWGWGQEALGGGASTGRRV
jgi:hypothetical protein